MGGTTDVSVKNKRLALHYLGRLLSIGNSINMWRWFLLQSGGDASLELGETVGDENSRTPFEVLSNKNLHEQRDGLFAPLDDRERKIIVKRFGLDGGKLKTLEEVGKQFGVTRERVRQL